MIRLGTKKDLVEIEGFEEFCEDREREVLENPLQVYLINNRIVGYVGVVEGSCLCGHPYISFLCVHSQYRCRGIAWQLLTQVEIKYSN